MVIKVIGNHKIAVDVPGVITINEVVGGISTNNDELSVASVTTGAGAEEPWLTMQYAEWMCIISGECIAQIKDGDNIVIKEGETAYISEGSTWKPTFPVASKYLAICKPAFRPDRCVRESENNEKGMESLRLMHIRNAIGRENEMNGSDVLYHMTTKEAWEECKASGTAYYPLTFEEDGYYTHATAVASRLLTTANHFYQGVVGEWIVLEFTRSALHNCGIIVKNEGPLPVGKTMVNDEWLSSNWVCPHIQGGIPLRVVNKEYLMEREGGGKFVGINGLKTD